MQSSELHASVLKIKRALKKEKKKQLRRGLWEKD
jgi:hypothetical protein